MKFLIVIVGCFSCARATLPHYIRPCARTDPNFNKCALQHANEDMKELTKGDRINDIPRLDPLIIDELRVDANGFHIVSKNSEITGLKNTVLTHLNYNFKTYTYNIKLKTPRVEVQANYEVSGKILLLPIKGKGTVNCTVIDLLSDVKGKFFFGNANGTKYSYIENPDIQMDLKRMYLSFTNLFNGNKLLENQMNKFLDENWKDVYNELSKPGIDAIADIMIGIINKIHRIAPFEEMYPEKLP